MDKFTLFDFFEKLNYSGISISLDQLKNINTKNWYTNYAINGMILMKN